MPRRPRLLVAAGIYHVMSRGNRREPIFVGNGDRLLFLELLRQVVVHRRWRVFAYCLMRNHYHLVVQTPDADLSDGMRELNGDYAQWFNKVHGLVGHLFQDRFHAVLVESHWYLLELSRYLAMNPVRAELCSAPADWPWSSYRAVIDDMRSPLVFPEGILVHFGSDSEKARRAFQTFVEQRSGADEGAFLAMPGSDPVVAAPGLA